MAMPVPSIDPNDAADASLFPASAPVDVVTWPKGVTASLAETCKTSGNEANSSTASMGRVKETKLKVLISGSAAGCEAAALPRRNKVPGGA